MKRIKYYLQRFVVFLLFPTLSACSGGEWNVGNPDSGTASGLISEMHGYLQPFVIALAMAGIAYNAITIIVSPTGRGSSDEAIAIARRRIIIIICAFISFMFISKLFERGF